MRRRGVSALAGAAAMLLALALVPAALAGGTSAASAQYAPVKPITRGTTASSPPPPAIVTQGVTSGKPGHGLPFTGLSLGVPVAFSVLLVGCGIALRRKFAARPPRQ